MYVIGNGRLWANGVVRKWGRTDLTGFYLLGAVRVRLVPSGPPKHMTFKGFQPDFSRILTGL